MEEPTLNMRDAEPRYSLYRSVDGEVKVIFWSKEQLMIIPSLSCQDGVLSYFVSCTLSLHRELFLPSPYDTLFMIIGELFSMPAQTTQSKSARGQLLPG